MLLKDTFDVKPELPYASAMAARQSNDWALEALGIRRATLLVGERSPTALASAAQTLGVEPSALESAIATATEMGRAHDPEAGLVAMRQGQEITLCSSAPLRAEGLLWAGVAHELGNALTTIGGWASVAASTLDEQESRRAIAIVAESAREAMDVAPLLLRRDEEDERAEVARVVSSVVERFVPVAAARGVMLRVRSVDAGEVMASRAAVAAIAANLVKNAIEACADGGRVEVAVRASARTFEILVEDDGRGMPEAKQRTLFSRRSAPPPRGAGGRGIGLSVVSALVSRAGGTARVTSTVGTGSCVRVELPRARKRGLASGVRRRTGVRRALIVEDHDSIAELVATTLVARGIEVFRTRDPAEALAEARRAPFDLALVDLDLGATSGEVVVETLVREARAARVVVMSGAPSIDVARADGVLRKPFDLADLDELLTQAPRRTPRAGRG